MSLLPKKKANVWLLPVLMMFFNPIALKLIANYD